jgi:hypothetical protein
MFDVGDSLQGALERAQFDLRQAQSRVAAANAGGPSGRSADAAMAVTARAALFTEALLSAQHARLEEIKSVTR